MRPMFRVRKLSALVHFSALALAACGGGGGDDTPAPVATAPTTAPSAGGPVAPAPSPVVSPAPGTTAVTGDIVAAANTAYTVTAAGPGPVTITLPANSALAAGDTVTVTGASATEWQIAQNAGQSILTSSLPGGTAPGTTWSAASVGSQVWHWLSPNVTGDVLVAGEAPLGQLRVSADAGTTWTTPTLPAGVWISSDLSADGSQIVAVQFQGGMYLSTDRGVTWTRVMHPLVNATAGVQFESVTMSRDGMRLAAVTRDGLMLLSADGGTTWTSATLPATTEPKVFRAVDSSSDGQVIVAVSQGGDVFRSTNGGTTFALVPVVIGTAPTTTTVHENWYRMKMSPDGRTIAIVANSIESVAPGTGIYVSHDGGATWTKGLNRTGDYTGVAMSDDGSEIAATVSNTGATPGQVFRSTDGGATFAPLTMPAGSTDWRAVAMSADGNRLAVAAGFFLTREAGPLLLSSGSRTTLGATGAIGGGGAGETLQLRYVGNGTFRIVQATGTFTPR